MHAQFSRLPQQPHAAPVKAEDPAYVAASIVATALEFRAMIAGGELVPEKIGKTTAELCMESYKWLVSFPFHPSYPSPSLSPSLY